MKFLIPLLAIFFVSQAQAMICGDYNSKNETITQEDGNVVVITGAKDSIYSQLENLTDERVCVSGVISGVEIEEMEVCLGGEDESMACEKKDLGDSKKQRTDEKSLIDAL